MACCNVCYVCKLQHNSFSIPLASDGWSCTKSRTIPPVFDTQITSITTRVKTSPSIFVFTFDAATAASTPETRGWCFLHSSVDAIIERYRVAADLHTVMYLCTRWQQKPATIMCNNSDLLSLWFQMFPNRVQ